MYLTDVMKLKPFRCRAAYSSQKPCAVMVLEPGRVPTTCYYVKGRLPDGLPVRSHVSTGAPPGDLKIEEGTWVIIVRHASRRWLKELLKHREKFTGVTYLKDDDIPAVLNARELPWYYALWTFGKYWKIRGLLSRVVSEVVVSTHELAGRYPEANAVVWEPHYDDTSDYHPETLVYFYHATITHLSEMRWLVPVVRRVQHAVPNAWFEIIGNGEVARMFRGIPRVRVLHPMSWPDYQHYLASVRYDVGIAPLMDTAFNRARSHTKLYQITRAGAAGIYSDVPPYSEKVMDGQTGVLCRNHRYQWVRAIISLLGDPSRRKMIHENARAWCQEQRSENNKEMNHA